MSSARSTDNYTTAPITRDTSFNLEPSGAINNYIWLIHVFIGVIFILLLLISFSLYTKRKREGRRSAIVSLAATRQRTARLAPDNHSRLSGASTGVYTSRGPQSGKVAAMTIAMSQFRTRSNGGSAVRSSVRFADSHASSPRSAAANRSGGTMEYLSPMC